MLLEYCDLGELKINLTTAISSLQLLTTADQVLRGVAAMQRPHLLLVAVGGANPVEILLWEFS